MLIRPKHPELTRQRLSPAGALTAGAVHVAILWLLLQQAPVQEAMRYAVNYVQPITPPTPRAATPAPAPAPAPRADSSRAITVVPPVTLKSADQLTIFANTPESSMPVRTTTQLPKTVKAPKPRPGPVARQPAPTAEPVPAPAAETVQPAVPELP